MLDNNSKKILKYLINNATISNPKDIYTIIFKIDNLDYKTIKYSLNYLIDKKLVELSDMTSDGKKIYYFPTNDGFMYFKSLRKDKFNKYWFPIITSVISYILGLITDLILLSQK